MERHAPIAPAQSAPQQRRELPRAKAFVHEYPPDAAMFGW
jgi:hypothetical protein